MLIARDVNASAIYNVTMLRLHLTSSNLKVPVALILQSIYSCRSLYTYTSNLYTIVLK